MKTNLNIKEKRKQLKLISSPLAELKNKGEIDSINSGLKAIYSQQGHEDLKTFEQWSNSGYRIQQGAKAVYLWGKQKAKTITENNKPKEILYFPIVALFSKSQVYKPTK